jgi:hypothetical protein
MLGKGTDGKDVLVAKNVGQISAMKLLKAEEIAEKEAKNWNEIYRNYCELY